MTDNPIAIAKIMGKYNPITLEMVIGISIPK